MRGLLALLLLAASSASADTIVKYGANIPTQSENLGTTKAIFVAHQNRLIGPLVTQLEAGAWFDNSGGAGRRSSAMGSASFGVHVNSGYVYCQALVGPAVISTPDSALGGRFQFNNDFACGIRDPRTDATIGFNYKHLSSAGIYEVNQGRDFGLFRVSVPW